MNVRTAALAVITAVVLGLMGFAIAGQPSGEPYLFCDGTTEIYLSDWSTNGCGAGH